MTDMDGETVWKGDYMPFGEDITPQVHWGNRNTYLGNEDDGGLMYFNARYYHKEVGRFMSCDPIKSVSSTLAMNPYVYCANNPVSYKDPTGLHGIAGQRTWRKGVGPVGGGEIGEDDSGTTMGQWEHGFDRPQYSSGTNTSYTTNAAQQMRANSRVKILMLAISYGKIARDSQASLLSQGYKVAYIGIDIEDGDEVSMTQDKMHEIIDANISEFDVTIIAGHNPAETGKEGKLFSDFSENFDADIASKYTTPVSDTGRIAFHICYSAGGSEISVTNRGYSMPFDHLGDMRDWAIGAMGGDANRLWTDSGPFKSPGNSKGFITYTNPSYRLYLSNYLTSGSIDIGSGSISGFYYYENSSSRSGWRSPFTDFMDWLEQ